MYPQCPLTTFLVISDNKCQLCSTIGDVHVMLWRVSSIRHVNYVSQHVSLSGTLLAIRLLKELFVNFVLYISSIFIVLVYFYDFI